MFKYSRGFTHSGNFHADDVFSSAFLKMLNPDIKIERGSEVPKDFEGIIFDIGGGEFDHHSNDRERRENGIYYASFGKLWRKFANLIVSDYIKECIESELVCEIDDCDNTGCFSLLSSIIYNMNGFWDENGSVELQNYRFNKACDIAYNILSRYIEKYRSVERAEEYILKKYMMCNDGVIVLEKYAPFEEVLRNRKYNCVIYPSNRGGYIVERKEFTSFSFPRKWWGTRNIEFVKGLTFCHASGFMCVFDTLDNALNAVSNIIQKG